MKDLNRFLFFLLFLLANAGIMFSQADIQAGTIHLSATEVNYGKIKQDSDPFRDVVITNIGKYPLIISSCSATCGCTVPNCPQEPIPAGKSAPIRIRYNTHNLGNFSKMITVYSNDQKTPVSLIKIFGEVVEKLD